MNPNIFLAYEEDVEGGQYVLGLFNDVKDAEKAVTDHRKSKQYDGNPTGVEMWTFINSEWEIQGTFPTV